LPYTHWVFITLHDLNSQGAKIFGKHFISI
jgi:hypothetical protein